MSYIDKFTRAAVETCVHRKPGEPIGEFIARQYYWKKILIGILSDRANGVGEGRSAWPEHPQEAQKAQLVVAYNRLLHKHIREECRP